MDISNVVGVAVENTFIGCLGLCGIAIMLGAAGIVLYAIWSLFLYILSVINGN